MAKKLLPFHLLPQPVRQLAGGGLLSSIGDALYQYVPPISVPNLPVRRAAPIDSMSAWNAAEASGAAAGSKLADTLRTSFKESLDKVEMTPFDRAKLEQRHQDLMGNLSKQLEADPAYFNTEANRLKFGEMARKAINPAEVQRAANTFKQWGEDEKQWRTNDQLKNVAFYQGRALDDTYGGVMARFQQETDPTRMGDLFGRRIEGMDPNGRIQFSDSAAPMRLDQAPGKVEDALSELGDLEKKITPWTTETGDTRFQQGAVDPNLQKLYQQLGGDATGTMTITNKNKTESNLDIIKAIGQRLQGKTYWRRLLTGSSAQALYADEYRKVAIDQPTSAAEILGLSSPSLALSTGKLNLTGNHLEVRQALREAAYNATNEADRKKLSDAYLKLRDYDDNQTEDNIRDRLIKRLNLQKFQGTSDVTTRSLDQQGLKPDASADKDNGMDLLGVLQQGGSEANGTSVMTEYAPDGKGGMGKGMPIWGYSVAGNQQLIDIQKNISQGQSVADIAGGGMGIYNASTLSPIASPSSDSRTVHGSLKNTRLMPGSGQVVMLPADPKNMNLMRAQLEQMTQKAQQIQNLIAPLKRKKEAKTMTQQDAMQLEMLEAKQRQDFAEARASGIVPALRMKAIAEKNELNDENSPFVKSSANPATTLRALKSDWGSLDAGNASKAGISEVSDDEAKTWGLDTEYLRADRFMSYDVYVTMPNLHMAGSESSQKNNGKVNAAVQQRQAANARQTTVNKYADQ